MRRSVFRVRVVCLRAAVSTGVTCVVLGCGTTRAQPSNSGNAGDGARAPEGTGAASSGSGGTLDISDAGVTGRDADANIPGSGGGGTSGAGGGSGGRDGAVGAAEAGADGGARVLGTPSECVAIEDLPADCDELCQDQGKQCAEECDWGTALPGRAAYYSDTASCERGELSFSEFARCDDRFEGTNSFIPFSAVRCCCAPADFEIATEADRTPLCEQACASEPAGPPECNVFGSCGSQCLAQTRGVDLACAGCRISAASFGMSYCSSFECVCDGPRFPAIWDAVCETECADARQRARDDYAAEPRPEAVGPAPGALMEMRDFLGIMDVLVDAAGHVWVVGVAGAITEGHGRVLAVSLLDAELQTVWHWRDPQDRSVPGGVSAVLASDGIHVLSNTAAPEPLLLARFDDAGLAAEYPVEGLRSAAIIGASANALTTSHWTNTQRTLSTLDLEGGLVWTAPADHFADLGTHWAAAVDPAFGWTVVAAQTDGIAWRRFAAEPPEQPSGATLSWTHTLGVEPTWRDPLSLAGAAAVSGGDTLAWGARVEDRGVVDGGFPWIARLQADGSLGWQWDNGDLVTPGRVNDAVVIGSRVCAASTESWEYSTELNDLPGPRCNPDDCDALTVRCFDESGMPAWSYHHRPAHSEGIAIAGDRAGRLFVAGYFHFDPRLSDGSYPVLMRWEP